MLEFIQDFRGSQLIKDRTVLGKNLSLCQSYRSSILGNFLKSAGSFTSINYTF